ncbi:MAG: hypothetical protein JSR36_18900 [Proteobacteria bacterium]|nr:hypothetical protein [Pseudomonadota bacterium]
MSAPRQEECFMLLQCEIRDRESGGTPAGWLRADIRESLLELNEACFELLAEQAEAMPETGLAASCAGDWRLLSADGRRRAAGCPYLVFDLGFADAARWLEPSRGAAGGLAAPFFTVAGAAPLAQAVAMFGWHLAHCHGTAARLLLGMSASCVTALNHSTLGQIRRAAAIHPHWLRPRWLRAPRIWSELLAAAGTDDAAALWRTRLRGQTLLAAEAREGAPEPRNPAWPPRQGVPVRIPPPRPRSSQVDLSGVRF